MKRLCGSALTARLDITQRHETLFRLLAYLSTGRGNRSPRMVSTHQNHF
jgi:hypothetical protein